MNDIDVPDWDVFKEKVKKLRGKFPDESSALLFRGQGDSRWRLTTTLERSEGGPMLFREYYDLICASMAPELKTLAGVEVPTYDYKLCEPFLNPDLLYDVGDPFPLHLYRYMAYLRHFGFPSPLLDWSRSPFVAAFFAFRDDPPGDKPEKRSVFAYCENRAKLKGETRGVPLIRAMGPYVQTHERHFRQRCDYTICGNFDKNYGWHFDSHQAVFDHAHPMHDPLWKFNLPSIEREKVFRELSDYNLNAFSLFGTQESLLETLWYREYVLRKPKM